MNPILTINVIHLLKFCQHGNYGTIIREYPGENNADILNQANYLKAVHGYVH